jgi:hypothetical protein
MPRRHWLSLPFTLGGLVVACSIDELPQNTNTTGSGGVAGTDASAGMAGAIGGGTGAADSGCALANCSGECVDLSTSDAHCGACGHDCLGSACSDGLCAPVSVDSNTGARYYGLLLKSGTLYYQRASQLCAAAADVPATCTPVMTGLAGTGLHIVANANSVYVREADNLWRVDPSSGLQTPALDTSVTAITADDDYVYYLKTNVGLLRQPTAGGAPFTLAAPTPPANDFFASVLATDGSFVYYFVYNGGDVFRVPSAGGAPAPFSFGTIATGGASVSGGYLYWTPAAGPRRAPLTTGNPENLAPVGVSLDLCNSPSVVGDHLYWGERGPDATDTGRVWRRSLATGSALLLAHALDHVVGVVIDGPWVYFTVMGLTNPNNGGVFRVAR